MNTQVITPASYRERVEAWLRHDEPSWLTYPERTPEERAARRVADVERVVLRLLGEVIPAHPLIAAWHRRLLADPACADWMPEALTDDDLRAIEATQEDLSEWGALEETVPRGLPRRLCYPEGTPAWLRARDDAIRHLLYVLALHRRMGDDGAEITVDMGMGIVQTTSLAAAVVEYVHRLVSVALMMDGEARSVRGGGASRGCSGEYPDRSGRHG